MRTVKGPEHKPLENLAESHWYTSIEAVATCSLLGIWLDQARIIALNALADRRLMALDLRDYHYDAQRAVRRATQSDTVLFAGAAAVFASRETAVWYWAALVCACAAAISRVADLTVAATAPTPATNAKMPAISVFPAIRISPKNQCGIMKLERPAALARRVVAVAIASFLTQTAVADVFVQWTFENAQFSDGGALTGFDFDATIGAVTDWSVALPGRLAIPRNHEIKFQTCFTIGASEERLKRHERIES